MWFGTSGQVVSRCLVEGGSQPVMPQRRLARCECIVVPVGEYCRSRRLTPRSVIFFATRLADPRRGMWLHTPLQAAELKFLLCRSRSNLMTVNALGKSSNCRRREARSLVSAA